MKRYGCFPFFQIHFSKTLPFPRRTRVAGCRCKSATVDAYSECSRPLAVGFPWRSPVIGTHPCCISACLRNIDRGDSILHRLTKAMGNKIGRTHMVHKLLVKTPSSVRIKRFGLHKQLGSERATGT